MFNLSFCSNLLWELRYRYREHQITALSAQLAFFLLLSLFPFLIFLLSIFGRFSLDPDMVLQVLNGILPLDSAVVISEYIKDIVLFDETGYIPVAAIVTLYTASRGVEALIRALNVAYRVECYRGFFKAKLIGILYTFAFMVMTVVLAILSIMGKEFLSLVSYFIPMSAEFISIFSYVRWFFIVGVMVLDILLMYLILPTKKLRFKDVWKGATFAIVFWMLMSYGFSYFVSNFGRYSIIYGSLAAVVILMVWLYFTGIVLMIGAELNSILLDGFVHQSQHRDSDIIKKVLCGMEKRSNNKKGSNKKRK
ncbi:MAG: YihY/virulence factor BrkB family protein [Clostridia bacterium]|nr:YihY/virulence factor BrkB family protein [Clostridia bacterium]